MAQQRKRWVTAKTLITALFISLGMTILLNRHVLANLGDTVDSSKGQNQHLLAKLAALEAEVVALRKQAAEKAGRVVEQAADSSELARGQPAERKEAQAVDSREEEAREQPDNPRGGNRRRDGRMAAKTINSSSNASASPPSSGQSKPIASVTNWTQISSKLKKFRFYVESQPGALATEGVGATTPGARLYLMNHHVLKIAGTSTEEIMAKYFCQSGKYQQQSHFWGACDDEAQKDLAQKKDAFCSLLPLPSTHLARVNFFTIGFVRNPCAYLVSVWSYITRYKDKDVPNSHSWMQVPCIEKVHGAENLAMMLELPDRKDPDNPQRFRRWVRAAAAEQLHLFSYRQFCALLKQKGFPRWDDGQFQGCMSDLTWRRQTEIVDELAAVDLSHRYDCMIHQELYRAGLTECLAKFAAQLPRGAFKASTQKKLRERAPVKTLNSGSHLSCGSYYDSDTLDFVWALEGPFGKKVGYETCCGPPVVRALPGEKHEALPTLAPPKEEDIGKRKYIMLTQLLRGASMSSNEVVRRYMCEAMPYQYQATFWMQCDTKANGISDARDAYFESVPLPLGSLRLARTHFFTIGFVRNPCSYLVSAWASMSHSRAQVPCLSKRLGEAKTEELWPQRDEAKSLNVQRFRRWVRAAAGDHLHLHSYRQYCALHVQKATESWDDGQFHACLADVAVERQKEIAAALLEVSVGHRYDCFIHVELFSEEMYACLKKFAVQFPVGSFSTQMMKKLANDSLDVRAKASEHLDCEQYYDAATSDFVWFREGPFAKRVGYRSCCAPPLPKNRSVTVPLPVNRSVIVQG